MCPREAVIIQFRLALTLLPLARFRQMLQVNAEGFMPEDESGWFLDGS
jgi:hypothetical protein